ncbi:MAG: hypothetical protein OJF62_001693 [Pseudolabrys sp.]|nr:hypothetical protein [Pseudolabrys sp.]
MQAPAGDPVKAKAGCYSPSHWILDTRFRGHDDWSVAFRRQSAHSDPVGGFIPWVNLKQIRCARRLSHRA